MSFPELLTRITPTLKRITRRLQTHHGYFNQEDLYQESLIHLWIEFQKGVLADKTDSYILQGCYFYLKNYLRTHCDKARCVPFASVVNDSESEEHAQQSLCESMQQKDFFSDVHCKLIVEAIINNGLTIREKEVFAFAVQGLTVREIAARLGISHVRVVKLKESVKSKCRQHIDVL
jgi:RNA polymerase sigma factor (sigma-70 family)